MIGARETSAAMAHVFERVRGTSVNGPVVMRYKCAAPYRQTRIVEATHPMPDAVGLLVARKMLNLVSGFTEDDLVVCLTSGGGSSLLPLPLPGILLVSKQTVDRVLPASGATITEMGCARRHLSAIKDGCLAAACYPAYICSLLLSDVLGDDPVDITSGPAVPDTATLTDALDIIRRYDIAILPPVRNVLTSKDSETIEPGDTRLPRIETWLIATPRMTLQVAVCVAREAGSVICVLGDAIEGEVRDVGKMSGGTALEVVRHAESFPALCVLLSGGETTVTIRDKGKGGRNVEFLLSLALAPRRQSGVHTIVDDTDSVDGLEEIAGAIVTPGILQCTWQLGPRAQDVLVCNDGHGLFETLGNTVVTGPTMINVNDSCTILVVPDLEQLP